MNVNPSRESLPEHKSFPSSTNGNFVSCEPVWHKFLIPTFVFVWPFVYFWRQVIPFNGQYIPIGNDFKKWYSDWKATVDSKPTKIKLLFGTFKSVQIPPGKHRVIFAYRPRLFNFLLQQSSD